MSDPTPDELSNTLTEILLNQTELPQKEKSYTQDSLLAMCDAALALKPDNSIVHFLKGFVHFEEERYQEASASYIEYLKEYPRHASALCNLGMCYANLNQGEEAIKAFEKSVKNSQRTDIQHLYLAHQYAAQGHYRSAAELYESAALIFPDNRDMRMGLASCYAELGELAEAEKNYRKVLELDPEYVDAHFELSEILYNQEQYESAIEVLSPLKENNPRAFGAYNNIGTYLSKLGRSDEAIEAYKKSIELRQDAYTAHFNLGQEYRKAKCLENALSSFDRVLDIKPDLQFAYIAKADMLMLSGQFKEASAFLDGMQDMADYENDDNFALNIDVAREMLNEMRSIARAQNRAQMSATSPSA